MTTFSLHYHANLSVKSKESGVVILLISISYSGSFFKVERNGGNLVSACVW